MSINNDMLMMRVGGGYLVPDEFIEQYLPIEMNKVTNLDRLGKIYAMEENMQKEILNRLSVSRGMNKSAIETMDKKASNSPRRSPSPKRWA